MYGVSHVSNEKSACSNYDPECVVCLSQSHSTAECKTFEREHIDTRWAIAKKNCPCFLFLALGHAKRQCDIKTPKCAQCGGPHHTLLHFVGKGKAHGRKWSKNYTVKIASTSTPQNANSSEIS